MTSIGRAAQDEVALLSRCGAARAKLLCSIGSTAARETGGEPEADRVRTSAAMRTVAD